MKNLAALNLVYKGVTSYGISLSVSWMPNKQTNKQTNKHTNKQTIHM
jgi:hypothetical protein